MQACPAQCIPMQKKVIIMIIHACVYGTLSSYYDTITESILANILCESNTSNVKHKLLQMCERS